MATKSEVIVLDVLDVLHKNETKGADMIDIIMDIMREMHEYLAPPSGGDYLTTWRDSGAASNISWTRTHREAGWV